MRSCPRCGAENPESARFCTACGAALTDAPAVAGLASDERRLVTALFADIAGFAVRYQHADPEDVGAALRSFQRLLRTEIEGFGGAVDKIASDVVLGVFGAPVAHEDDAERAVRAGLSIIERVHALAPGDPARDLGVRIGISTGEVVVSPGVGPTVGERITGDVVNTASRLQSTAEPDRIVVGESTYLATENQFRWESLPPIRVKGKPTPLRIWRPLEPLGRLGVEPPDPLGAPFVGRRHELAILRDAFERAESARTPALVVLIGEAGLGKSRLIAELATETDAMPSLIRWRVGRPSAYGEAATFGPVADIVKAEAGILDSDPPDVATRRLGHVLERVVSDERERAHLEAQLRPLVVGGGGGEISMDEAFAAWARFFEALASENTTVLVFEDMHDGDRSMLAFLERLLDRRREAAMLVILAARPESWVEHTEPLDRLGGDTISLAPMTVVEIESVVDAVADTAALPPAIRGAVVDQARGNPLYAEEFVRMIRERGPDGDGGVDGTLPIPPTVGSLLASRLDALPPAQRSTVHDASVVGSAVWPGAVSRIEGAEDADTLARLEILTERRLLRRSKSTSIQGQTQFEFRHPLVREVAHGQIPRAARATKHRAVADWLRDVMDPGAADRDERLAYHYGEAHDLAVAAGAAALADAVRDDAITHLLSAAARAGRLDAARALALYHRAIMLAGDDHPARADALRGAGATAQVIGDFATADGHLRAAIEAFELAGDGAGAADTKVLLARSLFERGDPDAVMPLLREALAELETRPRGPEFAHAATRLAGHLWVIGDHERCIRWADRALEVADAFDLAREQVLARQYRGASRSKLGDPAGLADMREALRIGIDRDLGEETATAWNNYAYEVWFHEGAWASLDAWEQMLAFCEDRGLATSAAWARGGLIEPLFDVGAWDRVLSVAATLRTWDADHGGGTQPGTVAMTFQGWVALRRGDAATATTCAASVLERAERLGTAEYRAPGLVLAAESAAQRRTPAESMAHLASFLEVTATQPVYRLIALPMVVRLLVAEGELERAIALTGSDQDEAATSERLSLSLLTARAVIREAGGDPVGALERYEEAIRRWDRYGFPVETARCGVGAGRCARVLGRPEEAGHRFADARGTFEALGATPWLDEVDLAIRELTSDPPR